MLVLLNCGFKLRTSKVGLHEIKHDNIFFGISDSMLMGVRDCHSLWMRMPVCVKVFDIKV